MKWIKSWKKDFFDQVVIIVNEQRFFDNIRPQTTSLSADKYTGIWKRPFTRRTGNRNIKNFFD